MPIRIPDALPAAAQLESENIFVMTEYRALHQDIRPLRVLILNLMPTKIATETQIMRKLSNTPLQVEVDLLRTQSIGNGLLGGHGARDLADRSGLAGTVNAHKQHAARRIGKRIALDWHKVLLELLGQGTTKLRSGLEVLLGRGVAQVIGDLNGDLGTHVTHDEGVL